MAASAAPATAAVAVPQGALPIAPTPLIGREHELATLTDHLATHRLVTLAGPGGIGKTRLAVAAAGAQQGRHADGVWFVALDALADAGAQGSLLSATVARTLRLAPQSGSSEQALAEALRTLQVLVVLDNCEHLIEPVATLVRRLLEAAPGLRILATSQEPLHLRGERLLRLAPLSVPATADAASAEAHGAVALLVQRVRAWLPGFLLDDGNRAAACALCLALDGVPLALELAAARVPLLGVQGVLDRVGQRLALLTGGARDAAPRHRTLRAAIEWSHALLDDTQRTVLRRLAVFAGSFSLPAAQAVVADAALDEWQVLAALDALQDKSLVVVLDAMQPGGARRLRLLDSIRSLAAEQLDAALERPALQQRHADWMCQHMAHSAACAHDVPQLEWTEALLPDLDNLRAALHHLHAIAPSRALGLHAHAALFWQRAGLKHEGFAWHERLFDVANGALDEATRAAWEQALAVSCVYGKQTPPGAALEAIDAALVRHAALGDALNEYFDHYLRWHLLLRVGRPADTPAIEQRMLALLQPQWGEPCRRYVRWLPALQLRAAGDAEGYRRFCEDELQRTRAAGDRHNVWVLTYALALAEHDAGRGPRALAILTEAVDELRAAARMREYPNVVGLWGAMLLTEAPLPLPRAALQEVCALLRADGTLWSLAPAIPHGALREGRHADAARLAAWGLALNQRLGETPGLLFARLRASADAAIAAALEPALAARCAAEGAALGDEAALALLFAAATAPAAAPAAGS